MAKITRLTLPPGFIWNGDANVRLSRLFKCSVNLYFAIGHVLELSKVVTREQLVFVIPKAQEYTLEIIDMSAPLASASKLLNPFMEISGKTPAK